MDLTLILGPMKSGKSYDLIAYFAPLKYSNIPYVLYQPQKNTRDSHITTRNGVLIEAKKVTTLAEALDTDARIVGIDELFMFDEREVEVINKLLKRRIHVIASSLDTDYRGKMHPIIQRLLELGPREVKYKRAVCDICKCLDACFTQISKNGVPVLSGLPSVYADDGTYSYTAVCRFCFVKE